MSIKSDLRYSIFITINYTFDLQFLIIISFIFVMTKCIMRNSHVILRNLNKSRKLMYIFQFEILLNFCNVPALKIDFNYFAIPLIREILKCASNTFTVIIHCYKAFSRLYNYFLFVSFYSSNQISYANKVLLAKINHFIQIILHSVIVIINVRVDLEFKYRENQQSKTSKRNAKWKFIS